MSDLMKLADPAHGHEADKLRLRTKVEDRIGGSAPFIRTPVRGFRPWILAVAGFVTIVVAVAIPAVVREEPGDAFLPPVDEIVGLPGIDLVVPLASGGVQTGAVDGDTIWIVTAFQNRLQKISALSGDVTASYEIDGHVEGISAAAGYLWLLSYDNGGEVLRFNPTIGEIDMVIPIQGSPASAAWFDGRLWVSNDQAELLEISTTGEVLSTQPGEVKGTGFGYLWVNDPTTGLISSLSADGTHGEVVIPTDGTISSTGSAIGEVAEVAGYLWLAESQPTSTAVARYDLATATLQPLPVGAGPWAPTEFGGYLWMTSRFDQTLLQVDPASGHVRTYPMPGKPGGLLVADGALWVTLYQPGAIVRLDISADLIEAGSVVASGGTNGHHLVCTEGDVALPGQPTIVLEPESWANYGSWSLVQALISKEGFRVCADGYLDGNPGPEQRAIDLARDLEGQGIGGPYVLMAYGDGVHTARLFADERTDIVGVVLIDPTPLGFQDFYDRLFSELGIAAGHPPWLDLEADVSESMGDFGDKPLVVIGQDPAATYRSARFAEFAGAYNARSISDYWQIGLTFYAGLSSDSRAVIAKGTGMTGIMLSQPNLIVRQVLYVVDRTIAK